MNLVARICFYLGAAGSLAASAIHVWAIFAGPTTYANLGAPPDVIASAEAGTYYAPTVTLIIAGVLIGWALYAMSAIGHLPRLLWLKTGLIAIAVVLIVRGFIIIPIIMSGMAPGTPFNVWSSAICFALGSVYAVGIWQGWPHLGKRT